MVGRGMEKGFLHKSPFIRISITVEIAMDGILAIHSNCLCTDSSVPRNALPTKALVRCFPQKSPLQLLFGSHSVRVSCKSE